MEIEDITEILQMFAEWSNEDLNYNDIQNFIDSDRFKEYQRGQLKNNVTTPNLDEAIKKAKPNMDKIKDVDKHLDSIR